MSDQGANGQAPSRTGQTTEIGGSGRKLKPHGPTSNENPASDLSQHFQLVQQEHDLHYYRSFLENLVSVVRDGHADTVAQIVSLIRSGASNEEIHRAIQPVNE